MAWTATEGSHMFREWPKSVMGHGQATAILPAGYAGLGADTVKVALYGNTGTPTENATLAHSGYNASGSQWVTANELTDTDGSSDWVAGGIALGTKTLTVGTDYFQFDAADTTHSNTATITAAYGCLVYDDTITAGTGGVADLGVTFHYFGGSQSVTAGTFSVIWHADGLFRITV